MLRLKDGESYLHVHKLRFLRFANNGAVQFSAEIYGPRREKTCLWGFANNTGADQAAHTRSLISAFVVRFLEGCICVLAH